MLPFKRKNLTNGTKGGAIGAECLSECHHSTYLDLHTVVASYMVASYLAAAVKASGSGAISGVLSVIEFFITSFFITSYFEYYCGFLTLNRLNSFFFTVFLDIA